MIAFFNYGRLIKTTCKVYGTVTDRGEKWIINY